MARVGFGLMASLGLAGKITWISENLTVNLMVTGENDQFKTGKNVPTMILEPFPPIICEEIEMP